MDTLEGKGELNKVLERQAKEKIRSIVLDILQEHSQSRYSDNEEISGKLNKKNFQDWLSAKIDEEIGPVPGIDKTTSELVDDVVEDLESKGVFGNFEDKKHNVLDSDIEQKNLDIEASREGFRLNFRNILLSELGADKERSQLELDSDIELEKQLENSREIVIGDLHGSALKALEIAVLSGVVHAPENISVDSNTEENIIDILGLKLKDGSFSKRGDAEIGRQIGDIERLESGKANFKEIYYAAVKLSDQIFDFEAKSNRGGSHIVRLNQDETNKDLKEKLQIYEKLVEKLLEYIEELEVLEDSPNLTFIGDVICDRGFSDKITMAIFDKLSDADKAKICVGNHDFAALSFLDPSFLGRDNSDKKESEKNFSNAKYLWPTKSLLRDVISEAAKENKDKDRESLDDSTKVDKYISRCDTVKNFFRNNEVRKNYENFFKNTQLFHLDEETNTFFSHVNIYKVQIDNLLDNSSMDFGRKIESKEDLSEFVKKANEWYLGVVESIFNEDEQVSALDLEIVLDLLDLDRSKKNPEYPIEESIPFNHVIDNYVHGHYGRGETELYLGSDSHKNEDNTMVVNVDDASRKAHDGSEEEFSHESNDGKTMRLLAIKS